MAGKTRRFATFSELNRERTQRHYRNMNVLWKIMENLSKAAYAKEQGDEWYYRASMNLARVSARKYCDGAMGKFVKQKEREFEDSGFVPKDADVYKMQFELMSSKS